MADFQESFEARLAAIAAAHTLLTKTDWRGTPLGEIIAGEVASRAAPGQVSAAGPPIVLRPKHALAMHMVIHELTTNALKYGGLKDEGGRIDIRWELNPGPAEGEATLMLTWKEQTSRALAPSAPLASDKARGDGFGTRLIRQLVEYELDGQSQSELRTGGLHLWIRVPVSATMVVGKADGGA
jgi:two-component sensor histidine kinase